jgi:hypothetical protein
MVDGRVNSYNCKLCSSTFVDTTQDNYEYINSYNLGYQQYEHQYESNGYSYNYHNYGYYQPTTTNNEASNYYHYNTSPYQNQ